MISFTNYAAVLGRENSFVDVDVDVDADTDMFVSFSHPCASGPLSSSVLYCKDLRQGPSF